MKKQRNKKLSLDKMVVTVLNPKQMAKIIGGDGTTTSGLSRSISHEDPTKK
jgi:hypothetical protein